MTSLGSPIAAFEVGGKAVPQGSMRYLGHRGGKPILTSDAEDLKSWRHDIAWAARQHWQWPPRACPVGVRLEFRMQLPKAAPKRRRIWPTVRPDVDKLARAVLDAISGIIWKDDAQVVDVHAIKCYAYDQAPGLAVTVYDLSDELHRVLR